MAFSKRSPWREVVFLFHIGFCAAQLYSFDGDYANHSASLVIDTSSGRSIPETLFGVFFEEINHAGAGGLWGELVSNRGFEAGGSNVPSNIDPWAMLGDERYIVVSTDRTSCFERNKIALRMEVLCDVEGSHICPSGGVGVYNPGFWGMNIEKGMSYKVAAYIRSLGSINISISLVDSRGLFAVSTPVIVSAPNASNWSKIEVLLEAIATSSNSRLQLTTERKGVIWFDQVSLMPSDTFKGHGFRKDIFQIIADLKPRFFRFPGGCYVEGEWLRNAFRWKESIGPWEERPGHFGDVWKYWTDDGLGFYEFLQLAEDLGALPVWVFNNGVSHTDEVDTSTILPFVQEALDGIEFAIGDSNTIWGSVRTSMGHPEPFDLRYVAIGNEDCGKKNYRGNYIKFYNAIKLAYPSVKIISNCDASRKPLDHPADYYDFHIYTSAMNLFSMAHVFDNSPRGGPKAFVSEYAVTGKDAGTGSLFAALAEAGFLIGLEKNSDIVGMACYAPLLVNANDRRWNPDAIVFDSSRVYGTPSYWVQKFFMESSGATLLNATLVAPAELIASAIMCHSRVDDRSYLKIKIVNIGSTKVQLRIQIHGFGYELVQFLGGTKTVLTSSNLMDENSFQNPVKIVPVMSQITNIGNIIDVEIAPHSIAAFDLFAKQIISKVSDATYKAVS